MRSATAIPNDDAGRRQRLDRLVAALDRLGEARGVDALGRLGLRESGGAAVSPDRLPRGCTHEWLSDWWGEAAAGDAGRASERASGSRRGGGRRGGWWAAPLGALVGVVRASEERAHGDGAPGGPHLDGHLGAVFWIGRCCWPSARCLVRCAGEADEDRSLLERSVFVDVAGDAERVWATDLALRCPGAQAVVADGSGLSMSAGRRLQLAAEAGNALGLLARPAQEAGAISAARTRWLVRPAPVKGQESGVMESPDGPGWAVELLRCKGMRPGEGGARRWVVRWRDATGDVHLDADAGDRPRAPARATGERRRRA